MEKKSQLFYYDISMYMCTRAGLLKKKNKEREQGIE